MATISRVMPVRVGLLRMYTVFQTSDGVFIFLNNSVSLLTGFNNFYFISTELFKKIKMTSETLCSVCCRNEPREAAVDNVESVASSSTEVERPKRLSLDTTTEDRHQWTTWNVGRRFSEDVLSDRRPTAVGRLQLKQFNKMLQFSNYKRSRRRLGCGLVGPKERRIRQGPGSPQFTTVRICCG